MVVALHQLTAALYLFAGIVAMLGLALPAPRLFRASAGVLVLGALVHGVAFTTLHRADPPIPLTDLPAAVSFMGWVGVLFSLYYLRRTRFAALEVGVAPLAFLAVFVAAAQLQNPGTPTTVGSGSWPHAHVLLSSAALSLLCVAGLAGGLYLVEHRRLKSRHPVVTPSLPSLESLDRLNRGALAVGFPLLTLGVVTGALWLRSAEGVLYTGTAHETWTLVAWTVYAVLAGIRFLSHQGSRRAAASAVYGSLFLVFAVIGVEVLA